MLPLDSLAAWRLDHAWMQDLEVRPIIDDVAIVDTQPDNDPPLPDPDEEP